MLLCSILIMVKRVGMCFRWIVLDFIVDCVNVVL